MAKEASPPKLHNRILNEAEKEEALRRLPKRLAYILRYGALKEGLEVDDNGYVRLDELIKVGLLQDYTQEEILDSVKTSVSYRNIQRYDWRERDGQYFIRAAYLRNFEKNPYHNGTHVPTLFESSMGYILNHLDDYDLQDFPDEHIIRAMIHRLKRQKRLSNKILTTLLVPTVTHLDLEGIYLTKNTLRTVWIQCPNLTAVSLKDCGYIMTDSVLSQFTKNLPNLERLNLCSCTHLTPKCLSILLKQCPHLKVLHIARVPSLTYKNVLDFISSAKELNFLDVFFLRTTWEEFDSLMAVAKEKGVKLVLREPKRKKLEEGSENLDKDGDSDETDSEDSHGAVGLDRDGIEGADTELAADEVRDVNGVLDSVWGVDDSSVWYEGYDHVYLDDGV